MIFNGLKLPQKLIALSLGTISSLMMNFPTLANNTIFFVFGPINLPLKIESLEAFSETGKVNKNLGQYFDLASVTEEEKATFREALTTPVKVETVLLSRILNTEEAERLLTYFGTVINIKGGSNGKYILRGAVVQASMEPEGISLINVLKKISTDVQIDIEQALNYSNQVELIVKGSEFFNDEVSKLADKETLNTQPTDFTKLPDIRKPGSLEVLKTTWKLEDSNRKRKFYVNVYKPAKMIQKNPVVVISHGLTSKPEDFEARAKHLTSYGYVVAVPQHPGSDTQQAEDFIEGYTRQIFFLDEFINRPQDITYTLDELERRNKQEFAGKLDLKNVGIFGHSFGGYTALALAGATIDFEFLERNCNYKIGYLNTALLLQCRALKLKQKEYLFRDERITAVFAINPVNASIFGPKGLNKVTIPAFMGAGSYDPATPFIFEQARSYPFLGSKESYLQLQEGQAHVDFAELDAGITDMIKTATQLTLPAPTLLDDYTNSMILAFFQVYITKDDNYRGYLQSSYADYLSEGQEFKTHLISQDSAKELYDIFEKFIADNYKTIYR